MPGSGKSTVGVLLAKAIGFSFVDVDLVIQEREGALLQDILDARGVDDFLTLEEDVVCSLSCAHTVITPGGSAVCRERAADHLRSLGPVVYLDVPWRSWNSGSTICPAGGWPWGRGRPWPTSSASGPPFTTNTPIWSSAVPRDSPWTGPLSWCAPAWRRRACSPESNPSPRGTVGRPAPRARAE